MLPQTVIVHQDLSWSMSPYRCYINEPPLRLKKYFLLQITICYRWVAQNNLVFIMQNLFFVPPGNAPTILCSIYILRKKNQSWLCPSRARCRLMPNFCSWATRKSNVFHSNHMLFTLDFTGSEHWAPFKFPLSAPCVSHIFPTSSPKLCLYNDG